MSGIENQKLEEIAMKANCIRNIKRLIFIAAVCFITFQSSAVEFSGGTGEPNDPYQIATAEHLISIGDDPNLLDKHYVLVNDIDLDPNLPDGQVFTKSLIANISSFGFGGSFDGNGHKIMNLTIHVNTGGSIYGLFGRVNSKGRICNLGMEDIDISGDRLLYTGGLVGWHVGVIDNCYSTGSILCNGGTAIGGLVGGHYGDIGSSVLVENTKGTIINCYSTVSIDCGDDSALIGGLSGSNKFGTISNCYAEASIIVGEESSQIGGLVGVNRGIITRCYSNGSISVGNANSNIGGFVGKAWGESRIINCYSNTSVSVGDNSSRLGGFVGRNNEIILSCHSIGNVSCGDNCRDVGGLVGDGSANNSFWDIETSGISESSGGTGLTTVQMQDIQTYLDVGWDMIGERENGTADIWRIPEGDGYPELAVFSEDYQPHTLSGSGTSVDPYQIATAEDLGAMVYYNKFAYYKLIADIDLSGITWSFSPVEVFNGNLDGDSHCIINLIIDSHISDYIGLLGRVGSNAIIRNLGIENVFIAGLDKSSYLGGLTGRNSGDIKNCYVTGSFYTANECEEIGILVGYNSGHITNSYSNGNISAGESSYYIGGLVGVSECNITNCYAITSVSTGDNSLYVGGLVGYAYGISTVIDSSYFLDDSEDVGLDNGFGMPLTDEQMKQQTSFASWDFDDIWMICEGIDYPRLQWQNIQCDEE
jgi:hypothetical protein